MIELLHNTETWIALITLTALEIVLGIDNIIFIAILVSRLPKAERQKARLIGLGLAMGTRILLLISLFWIMKLTQPLFTLISWDISGRDLILILGGLFLLAKSTTEIHHDIEGNGAEISKDTPKKKSQFFYTLVQIAILDIIFSLDSVITAVGMAKDIEIMILAVVIAVGIMMVAAKSISEFVESNPTIKILALSFLILVGVALIGEGLDFHIPKGYIYFAMAFSLVVEMINIKIRKIRQQESM